MDTMQNKEGVWQAEHTVKAHEVDFSDSITASAVFNLLQDAAASHADNLGWGFDDLAEKGELWMLSWMYVEFTSFPGFHDKITLLTWPKDVYKIYALRDFSITGSNNDTIVKATSAWLMINLKSKRIINPQKLLASITNYPDNHALAALPEKLRYDTGDNEIMRVQPSYSDIDINNHVNNARYVEYIQNCFPAEHWKAYKLKSIKVMFLSETKIDDEISFSLLEKSDGENTHFVKGINLTTGKPCVQALLSWQER